MTPVERLIRAEIAATGPIGVAEFMALCLSHPEHGYYITRDPLGTAGDFTTAPEISQMFGEMIGLWLAERWIAMGRPKRVKLVELGPGRGTLMADALRAAKRTGFTEAAEPWLVETSPRLRAEQMKRLPQGNWVERLEAVPPGPTLLIANEFIDALPIRQYLETPEGWRERRLGLADGKLAWGLSAAVPPPAPEATGWHEICPPLPAIAAEIARRLALGGAALIVDYGYRAADRPPGPTLQAVRNHQRADPLAAPGEADLTWLVDFDALGALFLGLPVYCANQGAFLAQLGIGARAEQLAQSAPEQAGAIADALERLTGADGMGTLFKVLAVTGAGAPPPPGFTP